jgi:hypothetical protein
MQCNCARDLKRTVDFFTLGSPTGGAKYKISDKCPDYHDGKLENDFRLDKGTWTAVSKKKKSGFVPSPFQMSSQGSSNLPFTGIKIVLIGVNSRFK